MTIAKVDLSKIELDHSLFEYEQHKMIKNSISSQKLSQFDEKNRSTMKSSFSNKNITESLSQNFTRIEDLENEFSEFCLNKNVNIDINKVQLSIKDVLKQNSLDFDQEEITRFRKNLKDEFNLKQNKLSLTEIDPSDNKQEIFEPFNLNNLYKWEQILKPKEKHDESSQIDIIESKSLEEMDIDKKISIYSQFYCYFYKKQLKKELI